MLSPGVQAFIFPAASLGTLQLLSQVGVILFMFLVGIELDVQHLRQRAHAAVLVSHASIIVPFFLGVACSLFLYRTLAPASISFRAFALFMGIAMSITAFPVLARILEERGLSASSLGNTAIACAAVDDVTAWCLLAVVVAIVQADGLSGALLTIGLTILFIGIMLFLLRPQMGRLLGTEVWSETRSKGLVAGVLTFVFAAALCTEVIGIHALFGAFLAGVIMPAHTRLRIFLRERLETLSAVLLLPLFFAFTGLRTQIGLLNDWQSWAVCAGIIAVAISGKCGGSVLAARWTGLSWPEHWV
jgi:K+:H+ antiporter